MVLGQVFEIVLNPKFNITFELGDKTQVERANFALWNDFGNNALI